jgi:beta-glucosidase-like glycosyl hydrolase
MELFPVVAVPQDIRWGSTYEAYSEETALTAELGAAYIKGLQSLPPLIRKPKLIHLVLATPSIISVMAVQPLEARPSDMAMPAPIRSIGLIREI